MHAGLLALAAARTKEHTMISSYWTDARKAGYARPLGWAACGLALLGVLGAIVATGLMFGPGPRRRLTSAPQRPQLEQTLVATSSSSTIMPTDLASAAELPETETTAPHDSILRADPATSDSVDGSPTATPTDSEPNTDSSRAANTLWSRFRGPNGLGISLDTDIPTRWSDTENVRWRVALPGAGSSSPILTDRLVLVTSYSGYGDKQPGSIDQLRRHITCIERSTGQTLWTQSKDAVQPEDPYQGMGVPEHGYATNTPVTDGERVFAFFGKSGVVAYDMSGTELWQTSVGTESGNRGWGTASSLILYRDLVIVNASEESQSVQALDQATGKQVWIAAASSLELAYGTPIIASVNSDRDDLILAVPGEVWGLNPNTGKLVWFAKTSLTGNVSPSVLLDGERVIVFGGYRSSGSTAIRIGGQGDVTESHVEWTSRNSSYVSTPVLVDGVLYWIDDRGTFYACSAKDGELLHRARVTGVESRDRPVYASPVAIHQTLYFQTRHDGMIVAAAQPKLQIVSQNRFESDTSMFNATPAVGNGELFLRSNTSLVCIAKTND
jgi:outer membrane protein assembly factor BamB